MRLLKFAPAFEDPRVLESERLLLREPLASDFEIWAELRGESAAFLQPFEPTWAANELTRASWRTRMRQMQSQVSSGRALPWFIFLRDEPDTLIGGLTLSHIRRRVASSGTLGYWMGERFAGQGYMSEAVERAAQSVFSDHGLHRIEAATVPENEPSRRVLARCGFRQEGIARSYLCIAGTWRDHHLFARLASDRV